MDIEVIRRADRLALLRAEWNQISNTSPMQSFDWLAAWWDCYGNAAQELFVVVAREQGEVVGIAPWYLERRGNRNVLRWLGDGRVCSDHATLLLATEMPTTGNAFAEEIAEWLLNDCEESWDEFELEAIDADDAVCGHFVEALSAAGCLHVTTQQVGTCYVDLPDSFDDYLMSVSKNHRKRCRRWDKQIFQSGRGQVHVATTPADCLTHWQTLVDLHNARRTHLGQEGAFEDATFTAFHRQAISSLAASGNVQLRVLELDGQPVAAEYVLQDGHTWYAYQSGMSEAGEEMSAGSLSILMLVQDAIAAGCTRLDLLRGDEPYKFSWGAVHRPSYSTTIRRQSYTAQLKTMRDKAWHSAKRLRKSLVS